MLIAMQFGVQYCLTLLCCDLFEVWCGRYQIIPSPTAFPAKGRFSAWVPSTWLDTGLLLFFYL